MTPINGINPYMLNALNAGNPFGSAEFSSCMASIFSNLSSLNSINLNSFSPMTFNMPNFSNFNFGNLTMPSFNFSNYFSSSSASTSTLATSEIVLRSPKTSRSEIFSNEPSLAFTVRPKLKP